MEKYRTSHSLSSLVIYLIYFSLPIKANDVHFLMSKRHKQYCIRFNSIPFYFMLCQWILVFQSSHTHTHTQMCAHTHTLTHTYANIMGLGKQTMYDFVCMFGVGNTEKNHKQSVCFTGTDIVRVASRVSASVEQKSLIRTDASSCTSHTDCLNFFDCIHI